jgi:hypothetical protein
MWPWGHAAVGYLLYSVALRATGREPPTDRAAVAVLVATQLPDLVDKPLSWGLGLFPTGYALGHSAFVALPVGVALLELGRRSERIDVATAFVVGYWSHLAGDVLDPLRRGEPPNPNRVLWPVVSGQPYEEDLGLGRGLIYLEAFVRSAASMDPLAIVVLYLLLPMAMAGAWVYDGAPGLPYLARPARAVWARLG